MSCQSLLLFLPLNYPPVISPEASAKVAGCRCELALHAPISAQPSAAELALVSGVLPELLEQLLTVITEENGE